MNGDYLAEMLDAYYWGKAGDCIQLVQVAQSVQVWHHSLELN
jgi:hypothetical protein